MGRASPIEDAEACIYGYGAVRFLANAVLSTPVATPTTKTPTGKLATSATGTIGLSGSGGDGGGGGVGEGMEAIQAGGGTKAIAVPTKTTDMKSTTTAQPQPPNTINRQSQQFVLATATKKQKTLACRLIGHGAIPLMVLHLQMINAAVRIQQQQQQ